MSRYRRSWDRRAVSPVVATIILVVIAVIMSATVYVMVSSFGNVDQPPVGTISSTQRYTEQEYIVTFGRIEPSTELSKFTMSIDGNVTCALSDCTYPTSYDGGTFALTIVDLADDGRLSMGDYASILIRTNVEAGEEWDIYLLYDGGSQIASSTAVLSDYDYVDLGGWSLEGEIYSVDEDNRASEIEVPDDIDLNGDELSLEAWVRWAVDPVEWTGYGTEDLEYSHMWANIINRGGAGSSGFALQHSRYNEYFEIEVIAGSGHRYVWSNTQPQAGVWYHVVGVYDGDSLSIYVNGVEDTQSGKIQSGNVTGDLDINIGQNNHGWRVFNGDISGVVLYDRALTSDEVVLRYQSTMPSW